MWINYYQGWLDQFYIHQNTSLNGIDNDSGVSDDGGDGEGDGNGEGVGDCDGDLHDSSALVVIRGEVVPAAGRDIGNDGRVLFMFDWYHI